jgi:hypothetical protein
MASWNGEDVFFAVFAPREWLGTKINSGPERGRWVSESASFPPQAFGPLICQAI